MRTNQVSIKASQHLEYFLRPGRSYYTPIESKTDQWIFVKSKKHFSFLFFSENILYFCFL